MRLKSLYLLNVILTIVLLASLLVNATINKAGTASIPEYDPWIDTNDDGKIDMVDMWETARRFGTLGTPINKTALLLELQSRVNSLNASLLNLEAYINTEIVDLETRIAALEAPGFMKAPAYDSGWQTIAQAEAKTLTHNLNTDPSKLLIYILGYCSGYGVHQIYYGGITLFSGSTNTWYGVMVRSLTNTQITVYRCAQDSSSYGWSQVRIQIWIIQ